jgi:hypothetical protein
MVLITLQHLTEAIGYPPETLARGLFINIEMGKFFEMPLNNIEVINTPSSIC